MQIKAGGFTYQWIEDWARIPETKDGRENGRTHGVAVAANGDVLVFNQARPGVLRFAPSGKLVHAWGDSFIGAHGMSLTREGDQEFLWLTDQNSGEIVKTTLDGEVVAGIRPPDLPIYTAAKRQVPTWVAVNEERFGGNGDIWITDGYGSSHIHRYTRIGAYVSTINGNEGRAGAFNCPHGIHFDHRHGKPELYIADRGNRRVQVYDSQGKYLRQFGQVTFLDKNDKLVAYLGSNDGIEKREGWPNARNLVTPGRFNSPHAMTSDAHGNVYVVEWIMGGRVTKLERI